MVREIDDEKYDFEKIDEHNTLSDLNNKFNLWLLFQGVKPAQKIFVLAKNLSKVQSKQMNHFSLSCSAILNTAQIS